jgi:hypothetical protein
MQSIRLDYPEETIAILISTMGIYSSTVNGSEIFMAEIESGNSENSKSPRFKASLRLWSDTEPLGEIIHSSRRPWMHHYVKGQTIPASGRSQARISSRHYASSEDVKYDNVADVASALSQWLDEVESRAPQISSLAKAGKLEAVLWVAIFGRAETPTPTFPAELARRAKQAGVKILLENYTIMDEESGNPSKRFLATDD